MAEVVLELPPVAFKAMPVREASVALPDLEPFRRELTGYCYRMLGSGFEAEDAVQEAMLRAWRNAAGFEGRSSVRSWLYRIATNVCIDMHRQVQRRARPMEMGPASPPDESFLGPMLPEATWVTPVPDARVAPGGCRPGRDRRLPGVDPAGLRHRPAAPSGPPARRPDPLRGAALAGGRGGRAARHERGRGQQRPAAGAGHPGAPCRPRPGRRPGRRRRRAA